MNRTPSRILVTVTALVLVTLPVLTAAQGLQASRPEKTDQRPRVLIIGASSLNSPVGQDQLLRAIFESKGIPMDVEGKHPLDPLAETLGTRPHWDYVVMDAWHLGRGRNEFGKADVPAGFPKAVAEFAKAVRAHSPDCKIALFSWWIPGGPEAAAREGATKVFRSCAEQAERNGLWVATSGPAFTQAFWDRPDLRIVKSDTDAHPGADGAYLNACSLFAVITDQSPVGLPARLRLSDAGEEFAITPADAKYLQELAWKVYQREIKSAKPAK